MRAMLGSILAIAITLSGTPATATATATASYPTEPQYIGKIFIPEGSNWETTPTVLHNGAWIPEEDPDGGYPTAIMLDNSPVYSQGWMLQINDSAHTVKWVDVHNQISYTPDN